MQNQISIQLLEAVFYLLLYILSCVHFVTTGYLSPFIPLYVLHGYVVCIQYNKQPICFQELKNIVKNYIIINHCDFVHYTQCTITYVIRQGTVHNIEPDRLAGPKVLYPKYCRQRTL